MPMVMMVRGRVTVIRSVIRPIIIRSGLNIDRPLPDINRLRTGRINRTPAKHDDCGDSAEAHKVFDRISG